MLEAPVSDPFRLPRLVVFLLAATVGFILALAFQYWRRPQPEQERIVALEREVEELRAQNERYKRNFFIDEHEIVRCGSRLDATEKELVDLNDSALVVLWGCDSDRARAEDERDRLRALINAHDFQALFRGERPLGSIRIEPPLVLYGRLPDRPSPVEAFIFDGP